MRYEAGGGFALSGAIRCPPRRRPVSNGPGAGVGRSVEEPSRLCRKRLPNMTGRGVGWPPSLDGGRGSMVSAQKMTECWLEDQRDGKSNTYYAAVDAGLCLAKSAETCPHHVTRAKQKCFCLVPSCPRNDAWWTVHSKVCWPPTHFIDLISSLWSYGPIVQFTCRGGARRSERTNFEINFALLCPDCVLLTASQLSAFAYPARTCLYSSAQPDEVLLETS